MNDRSHTLVKSSRLIGRFAIFIALGAAFFALHASRVDAATTCTFASHSATDVQHDWNTAANWSCDGGQNVVPTSTTDVVIPNATSTYISANAYAGTLTVGTGSNVTSTFTFTLTVSSSTVNNGIIYGDGGLQFSASSTNATTTNNGLITITQVSAIWGDFVNTGTLYNTRTLSLYRGWDNTGGTYLTDGASTIVLRGTVPMTLPPDLIFDQITINKTNGVAVTLSGNVTTTVAVVIQTGTLAAGAYTISDQGDWTNSGGGALFNGGTGTVNFNGSVLQTIWSEEPGFYLLTISNQGGSVDIGDGTCAGLCSISAASSTTISVGSTFNLHDEIIDVGGDWTDGGSLNPGAGAVEFNGTGHQSIGTESNFNLLSINKASGVAQLMGHVTSTGAVSIVSGTLALGNQTLHVGGDWTDNGTLDGGTGTVDFNGASIQVIQTAEPNFYLLTINTRIGHGGEQTELGDGTCAQACSVNVASSTTIASGSTLELFDESIYVGGNWVDNGTLLHGNALVTFSGTGVQTVSTEPNFPAVTIGKLTGTALLLGNVTTTGAVGISSGTFDLGGNVISDGKDWTNSGGTLIGAGSTVRFSSTGTVTGETNFNNVIINGTTTYDGFGAYVGTNLTLGSSIPIAGMLTINAGRLRLSTYTLTLTDSGTPFFIVGNGHDEGVFDPQTGTVAYTGLSPVVASTTYYNLTMAGSGTATLSNFSTTATNNFTISSGTVSLGSGRLNVGADWTDLGTFSPGTGIVDFNGSALQTINAEPHLYDVLFENSGRGTMYALGGDVTSTHNFSINLGALDLGTQTLSVGGDWTIVDGAGSLIGNTGTVILNGATQTLSGSTSFFNLTKRTSVTDILTFQGGATQTITGTLTLQGASGNLLNLRSSVPGNQWYVDPQGTRTIDHVDVQDSNNVNLTIVDAGTGSHSSGNNTNWLTDSIAPVITINATTKISSSTISNTTIQVTDDQNIASSTVSVAASTAGTSNLVCTQTSSTQVDCTVGITSSGNLVVDATDVAGNPAVQTSETGYVIEAIAPVISITAPTLTSSSTITNTTIRVTDNNAIASSTVSVSASTAGTSLLICTQTSSTQVDCTVRITSSGNLSVDATDVALNPAVRTSSTGYIVDAIAPVISITSPTLTSSSTISDTTIRVTDNVGLASSTVSVSASTAGTSSFACTQTSSTQVDCTINITSSGDLLVNTSDSVSNPAVQASSTFVIDTTAPSAPTESPAAGSYTTAQSVTLTTDDGSATIRYTTDGTTPSCTVGTLYSGAFSVSATETITSIACDGVSNPSGVSIDTFTIGGSSGGSGGGGGGGGSGGITAHGYAETPPAPPTAPETPPTAPPANPTTPPTTVLDPGSLAHLLQSLGVPENIVAEDAVLKQVYADAKEFSLTLTVDQALAIRNFIVYGISPATIKFGQGERRAISRDYMDTVHRPDYVWTDIDRISNGQIPIQRNLVRERQQVVTALPAFRTVFGHVPNFKNATENLAWNTMLYRIRFPRDLVKEAAGIKLFVSLFKHNPVTPFAWAVVRVLGYVK